MFSKKMFLLVAAVILFSAWLSGCYTVLKHSHIASEDMRQAEGIERSRYCTDCHSSFNYNSYYHNPFYNYDPFWTRRPFYYDYFGSYYDRWQYYSYTPWWWDDYYDYRYRRNADPDNTEPVAPKVKRDWDRREGFGGGGSGAGATGSGSSEPKVGVPMASPSSQNTSTVQDTRSRSVSDTKQEVKKDEKKEEKPQRRKDMN